MEDNIGIKVSYQTQGVLCLELLYKAGYLPFVIDHFGF